MTTAFPPQLTQLASEPHPTRFVPIGNPRTVRDEEVQRLLADFRRGALDGPKFLERSGYAGNKPSGGLWTSTYTPKDPYSSDWLAGLETPGSLTAISAALRTQEPRRLFVLDVAPKADVLEIRKLADAVAFTERYRRWSVPTIRKLSPALTGEVTDWASVPFDAVHLSGDASTASFSPCRRGGPWIPRFIPGRRRARSGCAGAFAPCARFSNDRP